MSTNTHPDNTHKVHVRSDDPVIAAKLLALMKEKNLDEFVQILRNNVFNIDHYYDEPENGTLLEIACRSYGYSDFVKVLIVYGAGGISKKMPHHQGLINQVKNLNSDLSVFDNAHLNNNNQYTYMQYACNLGLVDVVSDLLKMGFDPNEHYANGTDTPIKIAARNGYYEIVSMLINSPQISLEWRDNIKPVFETVLEYIFGIKEVPSLGTDTVDQERDYYKCLECVLTKIHHVSLPKKIPKPKRRTTQTCILEATPIRKISLDYD